MKRCIKCILAVSCLLVSMEISAQNLVKWNYQTKGEVVSSPLIVDSVLYIGSADSSLYALDAYTGEIIWNYKSDNPIRSIPAVYDSILCFESGNKLYALNLNGVFLWKKILFDGAVTEKIDEWDYFHSSPFLVDSIAYIGTEAGHVYGINLKDSTEVFHVQTPGEYIIRVTPKVLNNKIYFGDWDGVFYVYDLTSETLVWDYDTKDDVDYTIWENSVQTEVSFLNDNVYFAGRNCRVYCFNAETGDNVWKWAEPGDMWMVGGPVIFDSIIYIGSSNQHKLYTFDAINGGDPIYETGIDDRTWGCSWVDDNYVYTGSGSFYLIGKESGEVLGRFKVEGEIHSSPKIADSIIYFGTTDGSVIALDQKAFINNKYSETSFRDQTFDLGEISRDDGDYNLSTYLYNDGAGEDSVTISLRINDSDLTDVIHFTDIHTNLPAGDSLEIEVTIDPSGLNLDDYSFWIKAEYLNNLLTEAGNTKINFTVTGVSAVSELKNGNMADNLSVFTNSANGLSTIDYFIHNSGMVKIEVFDMYGHLIKAITKNGKPGTNQCIIQSNEFSSGVYTCVMTQNNSIISKKFIIF
jgi:eukaryotic-like serine/threonine-protein kinase